MKEGSFSPRVTLRDIARVIGVSHVTVSRALNNHPGVPLSRREEIQAAALRMGYKPNAMAVALGRQRHSAEGRPVVAEIAWLNYWKDPAELRRYREFDFYWKGARETAEKCGYHLEEFGPKQLSPERLDQILLARGVHGILIPPHRHGEIPNGWRKIHWEKFSVVRLGYSLAFPSSHVVTSDHLGAGGLAFDNICRLGYRRIGYVCGEHPTSRFHAGFWIRQLELAPKDRIPPLLLPIRQDHSVDPKPFLAWLKAHRPDAILTDVSALPEILRGAGYRIPEDIGLATTSVLDGNATAGLIQHSEEIGKAAMEMLISIMQHRETGAPATCRELLIQSEWRDGPTMPVREKVGQAEQRPKRVLQ